MEIFGIKYPILKKKMEIFGIKWPIFLIWVTQFFNPVGIIFSKPLRDDHLYGFILRYPSFQTQKYSFSRFNRDYRVDREVRWHRGDRTEDEEKRTSADGILRTKLRNKSNILNKLEVLFRSSEFCFFHHLKTEDI